MLCDDRNDLSHLVLSGKARYISGERKWILNGTNHQCRLYVEELASSSGFIEVTISSKCLK